MRRLRAHPQLSELRHDMWNKFYDVEEPDIFHNIQVAKDGGFSDVAKLWFWTRLVSALVVIGTLLSNTYVIITNDMGELLSGNMFISEEEGEHHFLITQVAVQHIARVVSQFVGHEIPVLKGECVISLGEMLALFVLWVQFVCEMCVAVFRCGVREESLWWHCQQGLWDTLPELSTFSAMRSLHFVTPSILEADLVKHWTEIEETDHWTYRVFVLVKFILSRLLVLLFGLDALIIKNRENSVYFQGSFEISKLWRLLIFTVQMLGIVQLGMFVRERLFVFIFAGEDSIMQKEEQARQEVWNSLLVRKLRQEFGFWKFLVIMLTFTDTDFQRLVLNEQRGIGDGKSGSDWSSASEEDEKLC